MSVVMRRGACAALLVGWLVAGSAFAEEPPASEGSTWSGFYGGLHFGYGWNAEESQLETLLYGEPMSLESQDLEEVPAEYDIDASGVLGGAQVGFNYQLDRFVLGLESDFAFTDMEGDTTESGSATSGGPPVTSNFLSRRSQSLKWFSTHRGRVGFLPAERLLLFATGGLAVGRHEDSMSLAFDSIGGTTFAGSETSTRVGWTVGGGVEYRFCTNWSAKLEYLYFDLGESAMRGLDVVFPNQPFQTRSDFEHEAHIARIGVNYRFWGF